MSAELERLATTCLFPGFPGFEPPDWVLTELERGLGGVVLFSHNVRDGEQLSSLTARLKVAQPELLVGVDEEGGDVTRLEVERGSSYPGNLALGAVDDISLTEAVAASMGADLAAAGINLDLAPVADVNTRADNPVIGIRSFGSDPALVARHVRAFVEGLQRARVAACAKHFPGHGATHADSHLELPTVDADLDVLRVRELVPFRAAVEQGVRAVMTAHICVPAVDDVPATVSRAHLTGLLRGELGFEGLVITDALEMRAISGTIGIEEGAVRALEAGADALCLGHDLAADAVEAVRAALVRAVRDGRLSEDRLTEAAGRVRRTARWPADSPAPVSTNGDVGLVAARRALVVEGDATVTGSALVVELLPERMMAADEARHGLGELVCERARAAAHVRVREDGTDPAALLASLGDRRLVLVLKDPHRHAWERSAAERLLQASPDAVVVDVGYPSWRPAEARAYLATFGAGRANLVAAAERLTGS